MIHVEDISVSLSPADEKSDEEPAKFTTEAEVEICRRETQNNFVKTLRSMWKVVLTGILIALFCGSVAGVLIAKLTQEQSLRMEKQHMANDIEQLQMKIIELQQLLNSTRQNFTLLASEYGQLKLLVNATQHNLTSVSAENAQLKLHLQEKILMQVENAELNVILNSTLENCELLEKENRQLNLLLNESLDTIDTLFAESKELRLLLHDEQQTSIQLEAKNQLQRSILFSDRLSFLWSLCNNDTLQCSRCLPGWVEHASRCFFLSQTAEKWQRARRICMDRGGDLAVVLNAEDQEFLTNMTLEFVQQHPETVFHSAWIGMEDMVKEGTFIWVNGKRVHKGVTYWRPLEPNNAVPNWDKDRAGQDCVAIVPPSHVGQEKWQNSWDDIVCVGKRHYLCESPALSLFGRT